LGIVIRQSFKASLVNYVGVVLGVVNQLLVATRFLSEAQIGLTRSLLTFSLMFASVCTFGAPAIADRFFAYFRDDERRHNGFLTFLLAYAGLGFGVFTLAFLALRTVYADLFVRESPELITYFFHLIPFTGFTILQNVLEAYCRNNQRIAIPAALREVYVRVANIAIILAYAAGWVSFSTFIGLYVALYGTVSLGLLVYLRVLGKLYLVPVNRAILTPALTRQMASFGAFAVIGLIGGNLTLYLDTVLISRYLGQADNGIFAIAAIIASLIEIPRRAITQISGPLIARSIKEAAWAETRTMHQKAALNQMLIGMFLFLGLWLNIDDLFSLMSKGEVYRLGKYVVLFISLSKLIDMSAGLSNEIMGYSQYYKVSTFFVLILALLTYATNVLLIPPYGITGAAAATALTILIYSLFRGSFVWWKLRLLPFTRQTLLGLGIGAVTYLVVTFVPSLGAGFWPTVTTIALRSALISALFGGLVLLTRVSPDVNGTVAALWRRGRGLVIR
jgi:O-antigen/teichoic acid export membrane protein